MTIKSTHPLMQVQPGAISSWREWRELWDANVAGEIRHGLLHVGFTIPLSSGGWDRKAQQDLPAESERDRTAFYLAVAEGWHDLRNFHPSRSWCSESDRKTQGFYGLSEERYR